MFLDVKVAFLDIPVVVLMVWRWFWWSGGGFGGQGGISGGPGDISEGLRHGLEVKEAFLEVWVVFVVVWGWSWRSPRRFWRSRQRFWRPWCWFWRSGDSSGGPGDVSASKSRVFGSQGASAPAPAVAFRRGAAIPAARRRENHPLHFANRISTRRPKNSPAAPAPPRRRDAAPQPDPPGWGVGGVSRAGSGLC